MNTILRTVGCLLDESVCVPVTFVEPEKKKPFLLENPIPFVFLQLARKPSITRELLTGFRDPCKARRTRKEAVDLQHPENICTFQSHPPRVGWASAGIVPSNTRM
ncbi:hypothetical protein OUZ56_007414 [Daphnia magna]|uniref:Uncharacterized protein n=1 Tax=Daphnia magna TaxID=35525 RepID=A0ABR0A9W0_9CRUS|nr:hypothetical protein OUZ56_007414 [Daphnia magna]